MTTPAVSWRGVDAPQPAFTSVSARKTLSRPETSTMTQAAPEHTAPQPKKVRWPLPVREYVQRAFAPEFHMNDVTHKEIEAMLKKTITYAAENEQLEVIDWETYPLPQQLIQQERAAQLGSNQTSWGEKDNTAALTGETNKLSLSVSKKRKSTDAFDADTDNNNTPPWRKTNNRNGFEDRITYASQSQSERVEKKQRKNQDLMGKAISKSQADLEKRRQRFQNGKPGNVSPPPWRSSREDSPSQANAGPVVGTCQDLEKRYLRLTSAPKPETVRPLPVLRKTLELLKKKWNEEHNYGYICDQFKSLRQDLTVQHIKNEFTVTVYEYHARIALEKGDLGEYNQCQSRLRVLYAENLGGHPAEFLAYRILYYIHTNNRTEMNETLANLTLADKSQPAVKHALDVRSALALGNYHKFFRLYLDVPNMGAYLMDMFVGRERLAALANMTKAYKTSLKVLFLTEELGFDSLEECAQFICDTGAQGFLSQNEDGELFFKPSGAQPIFEAARSKLKKVDIKGQI